MRDHDEVDAASSDSLAAEIDRRIRALTDPRTGPIRRVRQQYSHQLRGASAEEVLAVVQTLVKTQRWVAYELLYHHPGGLLVLDLERVERLGQGLDSWGSVDAFGRYISGPAWRLGLISDDAVHGWARSEDRWWRRAALVSTVPLNLRAAGGTGDARRTLEVCRRLASDRDEMVVKALSWALRALAVRDPDAVRAFLHAHGDELAARVRREVTSKLETGLKTPLENQFQSELHLPCWKCTGDTSKCGAGPVAIGRLEIRLIQNIEALDAELELQVLPDVEVLEDGEIDIAVSRPMDGISS